MPRYNPEAFPDRSIELLDIWGGVRFYVLFHEDDTWTSVDEKDEDP